MISMPQQIFQLEGATCAAAFFAAADPRRRWVGDVGVISCWEAVAREPNR